MSMLETRDTALRQARKRRMRPRCPLLAEKGQTYPAEFKQEAARLVTEHHYGAEQSHRRVASLAPPRPIRVLIPYATSL
jgi:hypothetical protein